MATLDSLPGDQRAVLQLVLGRERSYDEIAGLLKIDRDAVRDRALAALDALGPQTRVATADRQAICDYLLGQLPEAEVPAVRERLAHSAPDRAWARVLSGELAPVAPGPLPEIPSEADPDEPEPEPVSLMSPPVAEDEESSPADESATAQERPPAPTVATAVADEPVPPSGADGGRRRSSRRGGFVVIALVVIIIAVVVVLLVKPGGSKKPASSAATPPATSTAAPPASVAGTGTGVTSAAATTSTSATATATPSVQINLTPTQTGSKAEGIADVLKESGQKELAIVAQGLTPNTAKNSYEVWLYNSPSDAKSIGFGPVVGANGKLAAAGPLPANAAHYTQLIVTLETTKAPKTPGPIVMQGPVTGLS